MYTLGAFTRENWRFLHVQVEGFTCTIHVRLGRKRTGPSRLGAGSRPRGASRLSPPPHPGTARPKAWAFRVSGFGFRVSSFGFRVSVFGFRFSGGGFWVEVQVWISGYCWCESSRFSGFRIPYPPRLSRTGVPRSQETASLPRTAVEP